MLILGSRRLSKRRRVDIRTVHATPEKIFKALRSAQASVEIEGFKFTERDIRILVDKSLGKLSRSQFIEQAKDFARNV